MFRMMAAIAIVAVCQVASADDFTRVFEKQQKPERKSDQPTAPAAQPERVPRILFFTADWCVWCRVALEGKDAFPPWLRASGWQVDGTDRAHVQIVDYDKAPELAAKYGVSLLPAMVLIERDSHGNLIAAKPVVYSGRQSLLDLWRARK